MKNKPTYNELEKKLDILLEKKDILERSEEYYRNLYNYAQVGLARIRISNGKILNCNEKFTNIFGYSSTEECVRTFILEKHINNLSFLDNISLEFKQPEDTKGSQIEITRANGKTKMIRFSTRIISDPEYMECSCIEIHEKELIQKELEKQREFTNIALNAQIDTFFVFNPVNGKAIYWNDSFRKVSGYTDEEIGKMKAPDAWYSKPDIKKASKLTANLEESGGPLSFEMSLITKNKKSIPFEYRASAFKFREKETYIVSIGRDISKRIQTEQKLLENEKKWLSLTENSNDIIMIVDNKSIIRSCSKPIQIYTQTELINKSVYDLIPQEKHSEIRTIMNNVFKKGVQVTHELSLGEPGKNNRWFTSKHIPIKKDNKVENCIILVTDITKRKQAEYLLNIQHDFSISLHSTNSITDGLSRLLEISLRVDSVDAGGIYIYDEQKSELNLIMHKGLSPQFIKTVSNYKKDSAQVKIVLNGEPVYSYFSKLKIPLNKTHKKEKIKAIAIVPIKHENKIIGALVIASFTYDEFSLYTKNVIETLAGILGTVILKKKSEHELIQAIEKAEESENKFRHIVNSALDAILIIDLKGSILEVNDAAIAQYGYSREEFLSLDSEKIMLPELVQNPKNRKNAEIKDVTDYKSEFVTKSGKSFIVEVSTKRIQYNNTNAIMIVSKDITERTQMEQKIYSVMVEAEERERERYAKELHDGLGPILSTSMIYLHTMLNEKNNKSLKEYIDRTYGFLEEALQSIREISNNLSPDILKKYGIIQAIRSFIEKLNLISEINFVINSEIKFRLNETVEFTIYRTIIELINNTIKYANAKNINITAKYINGILHFLYSDDGNGFDYKNIREKTKGYGLANMETRIRKLEGRYQYFSEPGKGTLVNIIIKTERL